MLQPEDFTEKDRERFWGKVDKSGECWLWTASRTHNESSGPYGCFSIKGRSERAHRIALALSGVEVVNESLVLHSCDTPLCCRPAHLSIGTSTDNMRQCAARGRHAGGGGRRLNLESVKAMKRLYLNEGHSTSELARRFDVARKTITRALTGRTWAECHG